MTSLTHGIGSFDFLNLQGGNITTWHGSKRAQITRLIYFPFTRSLLQLVGFEQSAKLRTVVDSQTSYA